MEQIIQQVQAHVNDEKFFSARAFRQLSDLTGVKPCHLAQGMAAALVLYLELGEGAFFVANSLLIAYPVVATYVYPEERPARDLLLVYWGCFGLLTAFDRFLEAVPLYYTFKMCLLALFFLQPCSFAEKINKLIEIKLEENNMLTSSELRKICRKTGRSPVPQKPVDLYDDKKTKEPSKGDDGPLEPTQNSDSPNKKGGSLTQSMNGIPPAAHDQAMKTARLPVSAPPDDKEMKTARLPVSSRRPVSARSEASEMKTARLPVSTSSDGKADEMKTARLPVTTESQEMKTARLPVTTKTDEMKTARLPVSAKLEDKEMKTARLPVSALPDEKDMKTARLPVTTVSETQEMKTARLPVSAPPGEKEMKTARLSVSAPPEDVKTAKPPTHERTGKRETHSIYVLDAGLGGGRTDGITAAAATSDVNIMAHDSSYRLRTDGIDNKDIGPASNIHDLVLWPTDRLVFNAPFNHDNLTYHMTMLNNSQHRMAFAIKGNAIPRVTAYPAHGILPPKKKMIVAVTVKAFEWNEFEFNKDRICWEYVLLKEDDKTEKFSHRLLQNCEWKRRKNIKIAYNV